METASLRRLRELADLLDTRYRLPGGFRIGWDGILGLIPLVGDLVSASMALYILFQAAALGCPPVLLLRMGLNILIDNVFDVVPVLGHLFDFAWKSNRMNMALLEKHLANPRAVRRSSQILVAAVLIGIFVAVMALVYLGIRVGLLMLAWIFG